jgi:hypothetical protein
VCPHGSLMKIRTIENGRHTIEDISSGTLAAMLNLYSSARRAGVKPSEVQEEVFAAIGEHLAGKATADPVK